MSHPASFMQHEQLSTLYISFIVSDPKFRIIQQNVPEVNWYTLKLPLE